MAQKYYVGDAQAAGVCPSCGEPLAVGADFCMMCGMNLMAMHASGGASGSASAPTAFCAQCGASLLPGAAFCDMCGAQVVPAAGDAQQMFAPASASGTQAVQAFPSAARQAADADPGYTPEVAFAAGASFAGPDAFFDQAHVTGGTAPASDVDDDDPVVRPQLLTLTRDEARNGCTKTVTVDDRPVEVTIPAGVDVTTKLDIPELGYFDEMTGRRGPLRLTFFVV